MRGIYKRKGNKVCVNGKEYATVGEAATMIANECDKNKQTIRKEIQRYVQGKRPSWLMYGKYLIA